jgi:hypothetical protein
MKFFGMAAFLFAIAAATAPDVDAACIGSDASDVCLAQASAKEMTTPRTATDGPLRIVAR